MLASRIKNMHVNFESNSLGDTEVAGREIAQQLGFPACVYMQASMGMGKTILCKSIIQGLGYSGADTSPTYNLVQEYPVSGGVIYHMDLYRLQDPEELEYLALADLWTARSLFLVEWPERGAGYLPSATAQIHIEKAQNGADQSRQISFSAHG